MVIQFLAVTVIFLLCSDNAYGAVIGEYKDLGPSARDELREELRQAVDAAALQLQANMILALIGMANNGWTSSRNTKRSFNVLIQMFVNSTFDMASVITYVPRLLIHDMPTQFVQVLRLVRSNQLHVIPQDANEAIDNVLLIVRESERNGISENLFGPVTRVLPNLLRGIHDFLISMFENFFALIGAAEYKRKYKT